MSICYRDKEQQDHAAFPCLDSEYVLGRLQLIERSERYITNRGWISRAAASNSGASRSMSDTVEQPRISAAICSSCGSCIVVTCHESVRKPHVIASTERGLGRCESANKHEKYSTGVLTELHSNGRY